MCVRMPLLSVLVYINVWLKLPMENYLFMKMHLSAPLTWDSLEVVKAPH